MKRNLLYDVLIVFAVWFVITYIASGLSFGFVPEVLLGLTLVWLVGWALGVSAAWVVRNSGMDYKRKAIAGAGEASEEAIVSIMDGDETHTLYRVALPRAEQPLRAQGGTNPLHQRNWWAGYARANPSYAAVIEDVWGIMQTRPGLPAGADKHAGVTLADHSARVVDKILALAPDWVFEGIYNSRGKQVGALFDPETGKRCLGNGTPIGSPILPVVAFAHDIGKVQCLVIENGQPPAMLSGHGPKGAEMLRRLESVAALPDAERTALLIAVKYYHNYTQIPPSRWVGDPPRSLAVLLHRADSEAAYGLDEAIKAQSAEDIADQEEEGAQAQGQDASVDLGAAAPIDTNDKGEEPCDALGALVEALSEYGAVNGQSKASRLAWKNGQWAFILLIPCAERIAAKLDLPPVQPGGEGRSLGITMLLDQLAAAELLYCGDPARAPRAAIWNVTSDTRGNVEEARKYQVIVASTRVAAYLDNIPDCDHRPTITDADGGQLAVPPAAKAEDSKFEAFMLAETAVEEPRARSKQELSAGVLRALARSPKPVYGMLKREVDGRTYVAFDAEELTAAFEYSEAALPAGVYRKVGKADGKAKLVVELA